MSKHDDDILKQLCSLEKSLSVHEAKAFFSKIADDCGVSLGSIASALGWQHKNKAGRKTSNIFHSWNQGTYPSTRAMRTIQWIKSGDLKLTFKHLRPPFQAHGVYAVSDKLFEDIFERCGYYNVPIPLAAALQYLKQAPDYMAHAVKLVRFHGLLAIPPQLRAAIFKDLPCRLIQTSASGITIYYGDHVARIYGSTPDSDVWDRYDLDGKFIVVRCMAEGLAAVLDWLQRLGCSPTLIDMNAPPAPTANLPTPPPPVVPEPSPVPPPVSPHNPAWPFANDDPNCSEEEYQKKVATQLARNARLGARRKAADEAK